MCGGGCVEVLDWDDCFVVVVIVEVDFFWWCCVD